MPGRIIVEEAPLGVKYVTVISVSKDDVSEGGSKQTQVLEKRLFSSETNSIINPTGENGYVVENHALTESGHQDLFPQVINNFTTHTKSTPNGVEKTVLTEQVNNNLEKIENGSQFTEKGTLTDPLVKVLPIPQKSSGSLNLANETAQVNQETLFATVLPELQQSSYALSVNGETVLVEKQNAREPLLDIIQKTEAPDYAINCPAERNGIVDREISFRSLRDVIYQNKYSLTEAENGTNAVRKRNDGIYLTEVETGANELQIIKESYNNISPETDKGSNNLEKSAVYYSSTNTQNGAHQPEKEVQPDHKLVKLRNYIDDRVHQDSLHATALGQMGCRSDKCQGSLMKQNVHNPAGRPRDKPEVIRYAKDFLQQYFASTKRVDSAVHEGRLREVLDSIEATGSYDLSTEELVFGTKTAWRNAPRCLGRIQWSNLKVFDARHVTTATEMFEVLCEHLHYATNGGNIRSAITVFAPRTDGKHDYRVWNSQLIQYAGYRQPDGSIIGDPVNVEFTELCMKMGWRGKGEMFEVLPMVLSANGEDPELFEIPPDLVLETDITHPTYRWFAELGIKWFCVPMVSGMLLDCGGLEFTACPFNGWYMGTEIGARDLCDTQRYNILEKVAVKMGLNVNANTSLWKDRALVEVNIAVLHSFQKRKVTITDHHTASETFMTHFQTEQRTRGGCPADWVWLVPPMSGSILPVFHQEMLNYALKPSYEYQQMPWITHVWKDPPQAVAATRGNNLSFYSIACVVKVVGRLITKIVNTRVSCTIVYATETGKSENFAHKLLGIFRTVFNAKVCCMEDYNIANLKKEKLLLIVTSTFGNGNPPENGKGFSQALLALNGAAGTGRRNWKSKRKETALDPILPNLKYSVFGLGSSAYPTFCAFGHYMDTLLEKTGGKRIHATGEGDALYAQEQSFNRWATETFMAACSEFSVNKASQMPDTLLKLSEPETGFASQNFKLVSATMADPPSLCDGLTHLHRRPITACTLTFRHNLQAPSSSRETILIIVDTNLDPSMSYKPGDHLAIFPANPKYLVDAILARLDDAPPGDDLLKIVPMEENRTTGNSPRRGTLGKFPLFTLRTALTHYLDITSPPSPKMLNALAEMASRESDAEQLRTIGSSDPDTYHLWLTNISPTLLEVLTMFPSVTITSTFLIAHLPLLKHRYYSISSSPDVSTGEVHATLGVVQWQTQGGSGPVHLGVCSNWLNSCEIGETIPGFIRRPRNFHLPDDSTLPVIMVGPGTGIAPFRSFWQQRQFDMKRFSAPQRGKRKGWGKMYLYTGFRQTGVDDLYTEEIKEAKKQGVISKHYIALSRQHGVPKTYVQDLLLKNAAEVYKVLVKNGGHLYVCGDVVMASGVNKTLQTILETCGKMQSSAAKTFIVQMKESNRLHEDIFGLIKRQSTY